MTVAEALSEINALADMYPDNMFDPEKNSEEAKAILLIGHIDMAGDEDDWTTLKTDIPNFKGKPMDCYKGQFSVVDMGPLDFDTELDKVLDEIYGP